MKSALIIGNNEYENDVFSKLNSPAADTKAFADVLRDTNIGEFNEVSELHNDSYVEVRVAIETFFLDKKPDDLILLYFSGHGVLENNKLYLAVKNTRRNKLKATGISTPFINECMDDCRYRRIVLILDCCHSGAFVPGIKGDQPAVTEETFHAQGYGHTIITASDKLQYAIDGNTPIQQSELSLFTHHLLYGLKTGEADLDEDGLVSLEEWYQYSYRKVLEGTNQQTPCKWSNKQ